MNVAITRSIANLVEVMAQVLSEFERLGCDHSVNAKLLGTWRLPYLSIRAAISGGTARFQQMLQESDERCDRSVDCNHL